MSPETVEILIQAGVEIGAEVAIDISRGIHAGDVSAVTELAKVLPDAKAEALIDEALIVNQTKLAHPDAGTNPLDSVADLVASKLK